MAVRGCSLWTWRSFQAFHRVLQLVPVSCFHSFQILDGQLIWQMTPGLSCCSGGCSKLKKGFFGMSVPPYDFLGSCNVVLGDWFISFGCCGCFDGMCAVRNVMVAVYVISKCFCNFGIRYLFCNLYCFDGFRFLKEPAVSVVGRMIAPAVRADNNSFLDFALGMHIHRAKMVTRTCWTLQHRQCIWLYGQIFGTSILSGGGTYRLNRNLFHQIHMFRHFITEV